MEDGKNSTPSPLQFLSPLKSVAAFEICWNLTQHQSQVVASTQIERWLSVLAAKKQVTCAATSYLITSSAPAPVYDSNDSNKMVCYKKTVTL